MLDEAMLIVAEAVADRLCRDSQLNEVVGLTHCLEIHY